jgi:hypothetical protein
MYLLRIGHTEQEAALYMTYKPGYDYYGILRSINEGRRAMSEKYDSFLSFKKVKLSGELLAQRYSSWIEGKVYLKSEYPKQFDYIATLNSKVDAQRK